MATRTVDLLIGKMIAWVVAFFIFCQFAIALEKKVPCLLGKLIDYQSPNPSPSGEAKNFMTNMENLKLLPNYKMGVDKTFAPDLEFYFLSPALKNTPVGQRIYSQLYSGANATRETVKGLFKEIAPTWDLQFIDEVISDLSSPSSVHFPEVSQSKREKWLRGLIDHPGFIPNELYFSLLSKKIFPLANWHDLNHHFFLMGQPEVATISQRIGKIHVTLTNENSKTTQSMKSLRALEHIWESWQEMRIFKHGDDFSFVGGYYANFLSRITEKYYKRVRSPFRFTPEILRNIKKEKLSPEFHQLIKGWGFDGLPEFSRELTFFNRHFARMERKLNKDFALYGAEKSFQNFRDGLRTYLQKKPGLEALFEPKHYAEFMDHILDTILDTF